MDKKKIRERLEEMKQIFDEKDSMASRKERNFWENLFMRVVDIEKMLEEENGGINPQFVNLWLKYPDFDGTKTIPISSGCIYATDYRYRGDTVWFSFEGNEIGRFNVDELMQKAKEKGLI